MKQKLTSFLLLALLSLMGMDAYALEKNGEGVYQIGTAQDLLDFASLMGSEPTAQAMLTADIDMADKGWTSITGFSGTFDGQGHTISNLGATLFYTTEGDAVIRNLTLSADEVLTNPKVEHGFGVFVSQNNKAGAGSLLIENCVNNTEVNNTTNKYWTGAFVGGAANGSADATTTIRNCVNNADITSINEAVSGFIGSGRKGNILIENCVNNGNITASNATGGFLGQGQTAASVTIRNCHNTGDITSTKSADASRTGGLIGNAYNVPAVTIDRSWNTGAVTANFSQAGGLIGHVQTSSNKLVITYSYNTGDVTVPASGGSLVGGGTAASKTITGCWNTGAVTDGQFAPASSTCSNCYDVNGEAEGVKQATEEMFKSGEVTYGLNGDQSEIVWYQTLGEGGDAYPVYDSTHKQVFQATDMYCDGTAKGEAVYNNTGSGSQDAHDFVDGFCSYCHTLDMTYVEKTDTVFMIGTAKQLVWFSAYVNTVDNYANGALTADIDMSEVDNFTPIGSFGDAAPKKINYFGSFDGQRHIVSNLVVSTEDKYEAGLFGRIRNTTVKNLGLVNVTVISNNGQGRIGAIAGFNYASQLTNCFVAGDIFLQCTDETVEAPEIGALTGGLYGDCVLTNCWSTYEGTFAKSGATFDNCYYYDKNNNIGEDAQSGALCYALNGNTFLDATWFQTVGTDQYPVFDPTHGIVYMRGEEYNTVMQDEASFADFRADIIAGEKLYCDEAIACQDTIDTYLAEVEKWATLATFDELCEAYRAGLDTKAKVEASEKIYKSYAELCATYAAELAASATHNAHRTFFEAYLDEENAQAPGEYPNGSLAYILDKHLLSNAQVEEEMAYVTSLMNRMLVYNPAPGTEMTILMENPNFTDSWNGWEREGTSGFAIGGDKAVMTVARCLNYAFDVKQTLTEIPNGIYELRMNAMSRASNDATSDYYSGMLYLNDNINYVMSPTDGMIAEEDAVDGVNCLLTGSNADVYVADDVTGVAGYVPGNMIGCSYAFNGGRYLNRVVVEVKDSTLSIGVRDMGAVGGSWLPFANAHLYYLGTAAEAGDLLTPALEGYAARATTICDFIFDAASDYEKYPNISQALKDELSAAIEAVQTVATGEEKLALANKFSDLFKEVYDCRQAYVEMLKAADFLVDVASSMAEGGVISQEEMEDLMIMVNGVWDEYTSGSLSAEGARARAKELYEHPYVPVQDENGVYQISSVVQLMSFGAMANKSSENLDGVLVNDIVMPGEGWPKVNFRGTFDGQDHTISNLGAPLFYTTEGNSVIRNLTLSADEALENAASESGFGVFVCQNNKAGAGSLLIENCVNNTDVECTASNYWTGGFIGGAANGSADATTTIRDCVNNGSLNNPKQEAMAGFIGSARKGHILIENCVNKGNITTVNAGGGIIGQGQTATSITIRNCHNEGNITSSKESGATRTGGLIGNAYNVPSVTIENSWNTGTVTASVEQAGGLIGHVQTATNELVINNCYNTGDVTVPSNGGSLVGGAANSITTISNCWNKGAVTGNMFVPSVSTCSNCYDVNGVQAGVQQVTDEQLASGEVTYALNGDQSAIVWYQTLGEDAYPVLDATHKQVDKDGEGKYFNKTDGIAVPTTGNRPQTTVIYDLAGRRVEKATKGLYIINGKKVLK